MRNPYKLADDRIANPAKSANNAKTVNTANPLGIVGRVTGGI